MSADSTPEPVDVADEDDLRDLLTDLRGDLTAAQARLDTQSRQLDSLRDELHDERDARRQLETELTARDDAIDELRDEISRLDARTSLLDLVEDATQLDGRQRSTVLIQHLHQEAQSRRRNNQPPVAELDHDGAESALHYPSDLDRTAFYKDMDRAARLVDDTDLLSYNNGVLRLDLEAGSLPAEFTGSTEVDGL